MKKIVVDKEACIGCGFCFNSFPDLFRSDERGLSEPNSESVEENNQDAIAAKEGCPTGAIHLEDAEKKEENENN